MIQELTAESGGIIFLITMIFMAGVCYMTLKKCDKSIDKLTEKVDNVVDNMTQKIINIDDKLSEIKIDQASSRITMEMLHVFSQKQESHNQKMMHDIANIRMNHNTLVEGRIAALEKKVS